MARQPSYGKFLRQISFHHLLRSLLFVLAMLVFATPTLAADSPGLDRLLGRNGRANHQKKIEKLVFKGSKSYTWKDFSSWGKELFQEGLIPSILEPDGSSKEHRRNWARLIQKIYETDPLWCPKCSGKMKILGFIEDEEVIKKILKHLGLWSPKRKPPPRANAPPLHIHLDYSNSQIRLETCAICFQSRP